VGGGATGGAGQDRRGHRGEDEVGQEAGGRAARGHGIDRPFDDLAQRTPVAATRRSNPPERAPPLGRDPLHQLVEDGAQGGDVVSGGSVARMRETAQPGSTVVADQDVGGVEPAVDDAQVVEVGQRARHRGAEARDAGDRTGPPRDGVARVPDAQLGVAIGRPVGRRPADEGDHAGMRRLLEPPALVTQALGRGAPRRLDHHGPVVVELDSDVHVHTTKTAEPE
jgi:hypothetical protein